MLTELLAGFGNALSPENLALALLGALLGTLVGVLPGIGPVGAMALLLSTTSTIGAEGSLILFAGVYYGAQFGGSTTSVLLNIPGEASSVVTAIDGYEMAKRGRSGPALAIAALASFLGGTLSLIGLMFLATGLSRFAVGMGPQEYFALAFAGLLMLAFLGTGSVSKSIAMIFLGLALATVGLDDATGVSRFTFGSLDLRLGLGLVPVLMGVYGVSEVLLAAGKKEKSQVAKPPALRELIPSQEELSASAKPALRGTGVGFLAGLIPGSAAIVSTYASYMLERRLAKDPSRFGRGAVEGVAGPEAANNAAAVTSFAPLLALGIPFAPVMALVLSALLLNGVVPGPTFIRDEPQLFWTVMAAMVIGNFALLVLNLPLVGLFTRVLGVPIHILMGGVLLISLIGVYATRNSLFDIIVMIMAAALALVLKRADYPMNPLILAFVLGHTLENSLLASLRLAGGDLTQIVLRPVSGALFGALLLAMVVRVALPLWKRAREAGSERLEDTTVG